MSLVIRDPRTQPNAHQYGLHGDCQAHVYWRRVALALARRFTVVASDLRGYGRSSEPIDEWDHSNYCKRRMSRDQVWLMHHLGHGRFAVVGHDRGGRVAHRMDGWLHGGGRHGGGHAALRRTRSRCATQPESSASQTDSVC